MIFFVAGTDTDVGKTYFTAKLVRQLRSRGIDAVGMKPISCGSTSDAEQLLEASDNRLSLDEVSPVRYSSPVAPLVAAEIEKRAVDLDLIFAGFHRLVERHEVVVVEGVGGWLVPITENFSAADLAVRVGAPILLVVENKLGALNHTLLTLSSIRHFGMDCAGIVLNNRRPQEDPAARTNREVLARLISAPILMELQPGPSDGTESEDWAWLKAPARPN